MVYKWNGFTFPVSAEKVGMELETLEHEKGCVLPEDVVSRAKPKDSVLHPLFEWNDKEAAKEYRLHQARQVIRLLIVEDNSEKENPKKYRAFVNVSENRKKGVFINIKSALEDEETRAVVLGAALNELRAFKAKYQTYNELTRIISEIDSYIADNE